MNLTCLLIFYCKTLSTKTRIATPYNSGFDQCYHYCKTLSTKTRIATLSHTLHRCTHRGIAKHCPLKQGLRHFLGTTNSFFLWIAKHCPLKQGLRHFKGIFNYSVWKNCKTLSTKTRIATSPESPLQSIRSFYCKTLSTKTRIDIEKQNGIY